MAKAARKFSNSDRDSLISTLKARFEKNKNRHKGIEWAVVEKQLEKDSEKLQALAGMERTGGEPDVVLVD